ncbi:class F sortase [Modestobacter altitudinis]|uniref:class F sortase n=1 Tax=Modestobacter altitudinis TaxID=2213158 RepID=UPI001FE8C0D2|nr:class F sortase [Modestobacter altitudinis]
MRPLPGRTAGRHHRRSRRSLTGLRWSLVVVAVTAVALALSAPGAPSSSARAPVGTDPPAPVVVAAPAARTVAAPVRVTIPAIGVDSALTGIGVDATGALVPPADYSQAGWFTAGPVPGEVGPAVLAGHVDDRSGPAVFSRLEDLAPGDRVVVTDGDGQAHTFRVTRVAAYPKTDFATAEVYGPTAGPELRLITCGGAFDRSRRSYTDNVVVYARLQ